MYDDSGAIVKRQVTYVPGLYKIFDEIIVNAADNKQRDENMSKLKVRRYSFRMSRHSSTPPPHMHQAAYVPLGPTDRTDCTREERKLTCDIRVGGFRSPDPNPTPTTGPSSPTSHFIPHYLLFVNRRRLTPREETTQHHGASSCLEV